MERVGQHARHDRAVLERVADAGRRLRARADDPPSPVGAAREIERHEMQKDAVRRADAVAGAQETRDAGRRAPAAAGRRAAASAGRRDRRRRRSAAARAAAGRARAAPTPAPSTISGRTSRLHGRCQPVGGRVDVVGDAVLVDLTGDALLRLGQVLRAQLGRRGEFRPRLAQRAVVGRAARRSARRARRSPASSGSTCHGCGSQVQRVGKLQAPFRTAGADASRACGRGA